jgi:acetyl esterase/lipase
MNDVSANFVIALDQMEVVDLRSGAAERSRISFGVICGVALLLGLARPVLAQHEPVPLWAAGAPGSEGKTAPETVVVNAEGERIVSTIHKPSITPYLPRPGIATGAAMIIAPGGGHYQLSIDHEGYDVAKWLSGHGVAAFVLKYRLAREKGSTYTVEGDELADIQRAIRLVRSRATEWKVDPARVGVMGFSAGGELAVLASTLYDDGKPGATDAIDREGSKPAFQALLYPGLPQEIKLTKETPPAFLLCGAEDRENISQGLPEYYLSLRKAGVSAELHVYASVGHGFGLRLSNHGSYSEWPSLFLAWLDTKGFLKAK